MCLGSKIQSQILGFLMCDSVWKKQGDAENAAACSSLCPAEQSHLGTHLNIHIHLHAPHVLGDTPVRGSWYNFSFDFRQPSLHPLSNSGAADPQPPHPQATVGLLQGEELHWLWHLWIFYSQNRVLPCLFGLYLIACITIQVPDSCPRPHSP